jgi:lipopolysaccharide transport system ATP-binding protein
MKEEKEWQIAIFGTFDVENYGDLLFPIIAEAELVRRLGRVKLHRFSYHAKSAQDWSYAVSSVTELPKLAAQLDGMLIGGGFIIRFDKNVAPAYAPPSPGIHHPTGYWLSPALIALQHGIPLIWNAPGMHCNDIPEWAEALMSLVIGNSPYIRVRDKLSQQALQRFSPQSRVGVLPDTAFGLPLLIDDQNPSREFQAWSRQAGLDKPYIVIHAIRGLDRLLRLIRENPQAFAGYQFLLLPIGPVLGDTESLVDHGLPGAVRLQGWPSPLLLAEFLARAEAVVGHSYHLMISALAFGVPVFSSADMAAGKYSELARQENLFPLSRQEDPDLQWFLARLGKKQRTAAVTHAMAELREHWDEVARRVQAGGRDMSETIDRFWQALPAHLESAGGHSSSMNKLQAEIDSGQQRAVRLEQEVVRLQREYNELRNSHSMKVTAPLRLAMNTLKTLTGRQ